MKRRLLLFVTLLGGLTITMVMVNRKGAFSGRDTAFAVRPGTVISAISLRQGNSSIELRNTRDGWVVNRAGEARGGAVEMLVRTLHEIEVKSPLSNELFREQTGEGNASAVVVKAWSGRRRVASFRVYRTDSNIYGNIMKRRENSKPFIAYIPGYQNPIGQIFNMNELFWLPFRIFNTYPSDIESVELVYPNSSEDGFLICNPTLPAIGRESGNCLAEYDTSAVMRYLSYFTWVPFESWAFDLSREEVQEISSSIPLAIIRLKTTEREYCLKIWERNIVKGEEVVRDMYRVWGMIGDYDGVFVARYFDLDPLLRKKSYFRDDK